MNTRRLHEGQLDEAAGLLRAGALVAFPTETVYGLGADGTNPEAVRRIFEAKGRPADNPLILHICDEAMLQGLVAEVSDTARRLMDAFWPGPLTLVFTKSAAVLDEVSAGLDTVGVRMPAHSLARQLIRRTGRPVAAPSANRSGRPSPTRAEHVLADLGGRIEAVLEGGPAQVGLESTIVDVSSEPPCLLRPGGVTLEEMGRVVGAVELDSHLLGADDAGAPRAPGMKYRHYAPDAEVILLAGSRKAQGDALKQTLASAGVARPAGLIASPALLEALEGELGEDGLFCRTLGEDIDDAGLGRHLYAALREADQAGVRTVFVESFPERGMGRALMNRLKKAAAKEEKR